MKEKLRVLYVLRNNLDQGRGLQGKRDEWRSKQAIRPVFFVGKRAII